MSKDPTAMKDSEAWPILIGGVIAFCAFLSAVLSDCAPIAWMLFGVWLCKGGGRAYDKRMEKLRSQKGS